MVWVQDKTSQDTHLFQRSVSLFCTVAQSTHPHMPAYRTPTPISNRLAHNHPTQDRLFWASEESVSSFAASPAAVPSPGACSVLAPSMGSGPRGGRGEPSLAGSSANTQRIHHSPLPAGPWGEEVPAPTPPPLPRPSPTRSSPPLSLTSSMASAAATEEASSGPGNCFT